MTDPSHHSPDDALPHIATLKPFYAEPDAGRNYFWCACGRSGNQPYCDGSHKGTGIEPVRFRTERPGEEVLFCGCKQTRTPPFCDGSHNNLPGAYELDDPDSPANRSVTAVEADADGLAMLDGGCYVLDPGRVSFERHGSLSIAPVISSENGATFQSQFALRVSAGEPVPMRFPSSHAIVFTTAGAGELEIGDRRFALQPNTAALVLPGETFSLAADEGLSAFVSACPASGGPEIADVSGPASSGTPFDDSQPERVVGIDEEQRHAMGERFFQVMLDEHTGCGIAALFIGEIPTSKAVPHRHLYEESLIVLSGEGVMWTEARRTGVKPGDAIFLPRKQTHSLQCTSESPMLLAGVISPGTNPSINY